MLFALLSPAFANGLTSHQWITLQAVDQLPAGELRDFLTREDLRPYLLNGALFPDGGYAIGDDYGEMAHWEPFQMRFMAWIRDGATGTEPDGVATADACKAFLFGLSSHGMGDQTFDSMFMERSKVYDAAYGWADGESMDEATDVALAAAEGPGEVPEPWFPPVFPELMADAGHEVSADTMLHGTQLAGLAIRTVGVMGGIDTTVASYAEQFPWANGHIVDPETRCSPVCEAGIVAAYWPGIWDRLEGGEGWDTPVIATIPADGAWAQPTEAGTPESRVSVVLARGLIPDSVVPGVITVADAAGTDVPVNLNLFYGFSSQVILVESPTGWAADTDYVVTVHPGILTFDGPAMTDTYTFSFSTRPAPVDTGAADDSGAVADTDDGAEGCGCAGVSGPGGWIGLLVAAGVVGRRRR